MHAAVHAGGGLADGLREAAVVSDRVCQARDHAVYGEVKVVCAEEVFQRLGRSPAEAAVRRLRPLSFRVAKSSTVPAPLLNASPRLFTFTQFSSLFPKISI